MGCHGARSEAAARRAVIGLWNACRKVGDAGLPVSCVLCGWRFGEAVALSWIRSVFPNLGSRNENQTRLF